MTPAPPNSEKTDKPRDGKAPAYMFYPSDFERDVTALSLAAQGLWIRMLGWMHQNEAHRGFLELPNGEPMTNAHIARRVGRSAREVNRLMSELETYSVFSRTPAGTAYCRRMAREIEMSEKRRAAAKSRADTAHRAANGRFAGSDAGVSGGASEPQTTPVGAPAGEPKKADLSSSSSFSVSDSLNTDLDCSPQIRKRRDSAASVSDSRPSEIKKYPLLREVLYQCFKEEGQEPIYPSDRLVVDVMNAAGGASEQEVIECLKYLYSERGLQPGTRNGPRHWSWFVTVVRDQFAQKRAQEDAANPCGYHEWAERNDYRLDKETFDAMTDALD